MSTGKYANVIIDISHEKIDRPFQYIIPDSLLDRIKLGDCVKVPFGQYNSPKKAYVISFSDDNEYPIEKLKNIIDIEQSDVGVEADAIKLAIWMKNTYGSTMIVALKTVLCAKKVAKMKEKKKIVRSMSLEEIQSLYAQALKKKQSAKVRVLNELKTEELLPYDLVVNKLHVSASTLNSLKAEGAIHIETESYYRNPVKIGDVANEHKVLSDEQKYICDEISKDMDNGINASNGGGKYLIHGITGSGKTEVYIKLIEKCISLNKQCIMLIPEIALTYQTLLRFYKRFGDRVSVMNSTLTPSEKYDQCMRAKDGQIDVIIGPRSALFVPFNNLGLVIIDEEHETSYISEANPRYHAIETAQELCRIKKASLVLGSATPSIDSYFKAKNGIYRLFKLSKRLTGGELPNVDIVDLRTELKEGNRSILSRSLQEKIKDRLSRKEQVMLFLNRRGYSGFISCRSCGHVMKCPHCDVSLSRHKKGKLMCHYCGYETDDVKTCPKCNSKYISAFKAGTEQVEEALIKLYPGIRVLRMDADTTKSKDSYEKILETFSLNEADVLVGTQMIVKGHDFPNVTLVGVIAADISLNESDFRTGERTFQLLTQAVGRAGRGEKKGDAIIQTYNPEHYSIVNASKQDYDSFYEEEVLYRIMGDYPPLGLMLKIQVQSKDERRAYGLAIALAKKVPDDIKKIGPSEDPIFKMNDYYRYNIYLKSKDVYALSECRNEMEEYLLKAPLITESVTFDIK